MVGSRGRAAFATGQGSAVPFVARPAPQKATEADRWANQQFEELERVLRAQAARIADLEALVGSGRSWDEL